MIIHVYEIFYLSNGTSYQCFTYTLCPVSTPVSKDMQGHWVSEMIEVSKDTGCQK